MTKIDQLNDYLDERGGQFTNAIDEINELLKNGGISHEERQELVLKRNKLQVAKANFKADVLLEIEEERRKIYAAKEDEE